MPDQFIKFPRVESIQYFESAMYGHNKVLRCKKISDSYYEIQREDLPPIFVFVSNYYALSVSDYYEITSEYQIDCLVTISNWNRVTQDAYELGRRNGIGVFTMKRLKDVLAEAIYDTCNIPVHYTTLSENEYEEMYALRQEKQCVLFEYYHK